MTEKTIARSLSTAFYGTSFLVMGTASYPAQEEILTATETIGRLGVGTLGIASTALAISGVVVLASAIKNLPNRNTPQP